MKATKDELTDAVATQQAQEAELNCVKKCLHDKNSELFDAECKVELLQEITAEADKIKEANDARQAGLVAACASLDAQQACLDKRVASNDADIGFLKKANSQMSVVNSGLVAKVRGRREQNTDRYYYTSNQ